MEGEGQEKTTNNANNDIEPIETVDEPKTEPVEEKTQEEKPEKQKADSYLETIKEKAKAYDEAVAGKTFVKPPPKGVAKNNVICELCNKIMRESSFTEHYERCLKKYQNPKPELKVMPRDMKRGKTKELSLKKDEKQPKIIKQKVITTVTQDSEPVEEQKPDPYNDVLTEQQQQVPIVQPPKPLTRKEKLSLLAMSGLPC